MVKSDAAIPLCKELETWCEEQKLPYLRADDLATKGGLNDEQQAWLADFRLRWEGLKAMDSLTAQANASKSEGDRLFVGLYPGGVVYADRGREVHGDYARLAVLGYRKLELAIEKDCPQELRLLIEADAATFQARRGQQLEISTAGQTVLLGSDLS